MRDCQDGVGAQLALGRGAVEGEHGVIELALVAGVHAFQLGGDHLVDVVDRFEHALAGVACLVAVAQLHGFVLAGGGSAGHGSAAAGAAFQDDIGFDGRISTGIQNFTAQESAQSESYKSCSPAWRFACARREAVRNQPLYGSVDDGNR